MFAVVGSAPPFASYQQKFYQDNDTCGVTCYSQTGPVSKLEWNFPQTVVLFELSSAAIGDRENKYTDEDIKHVYATSYGQTQAYTTFIHSIPHIPMLLMLLISAIVDHSLHTSTRFSKSRV